MMSEKQKNLITRSIFGALFVAIMVLGFTRPHYMVVLFAVITGMTLWEFSGLVNDQKGISVNRFISTAAGVYFFVAVAGQRMGFVEGFIIPEESWEQKINDVKEYHVDTVVMGGDWAGSDKFDYLKDYCELVFLDRTPGVSTTQIKKDLGLQEAVSGIDQLPGEPEE